MKDSIYIIKDTTINIINKSHTDSNLNFIFQNKQDDDSSIFTNLITIALALIAATIALYQVKLNIISSARINWIENLRATISEYCAEAEKITIILINMKDEGIDDDVDNSLEKWYPEYSASADRYHSLAVKLRLYLNIKEVNHLEIETNVNAITYILEKKSIAEIKKNEVENHLNSILNASRLIFKQEWDRSKHVFKK